MLPSTVAPTNGPRTMPSRIDILPVERVKSARISENSTLPRPAPPGAFDTTRSSAGSPRTTKLRMNKVPTCGA